jgi:hypothetical protein
MNPVRTGYFDTHNQTPMGGPYPSPAYQGAWGAYPYLPSGNVLVSDMQNGLFVLDPGGSTTGLESVSATFGATLYPSPVLSGQNVQLRVPDFKGGKVFVRDLAGRTVYTAQWITGDQQQFSADFAPGHYLVSFENSSAIARLVVR